MSLAVVLNNAELRELLSLILGFLKDLRRIQDGSRT
jgi:hypothetical protein